MVRYHGSGGNVGWLMCVWILFFSRFFGGCVARQWWRVGSLVFKRGTLQGSEKSSRPETFCLCRDHQVNTLIGN